MMSKKSRRSTFKACLAPILGVASLLLVTSCASQVHTDEIIELEAVDLFNRSKLTVRRRSIDDPNRASIDVSWHEGVDFSGSGRLCNVEARHYCLVLNGLWTFAIPRLESADEYYIGLRWAFDQLDFQIDETVRLPINGETYRVFIISSGNSSGDQYFFHFVPDIGLVAVSAIYADSKQPDIDPLSPIDLFKPTVWIVTR